VSAQQRCLSLGAVAPCGRNAVWVALICAVVVGLLQKKKIKFLLTILCFLRKNFIYNGEVTLVCKHVSPLKLLDGFLTILILFNYHPVSATFYMNGIYSMLFSILYKPASFALMIIYLSRLQIHCYIFNHTAQPDIIFFVFHQKM
jgi:hypothetical protein